MGYEYVIAPQRGDPVEGKGVISYVGAYAPAANAWSVSIEQPFRNTLGTHVRRVGDRWVEVILP